jgi:ADP-ribose pyrophosphatase YjhB (NUDIX family)/GNAT superfamily N-acetyltransferase
MTYPTSIKGVLLVKGKVLLVRNEREEWELPGGRLEIGETPEQALEREFDEELALEIEPLQLVDSYLFEVVPSKNVFIVTYGCRLRGGFEPRVSSEHSAFGLHDVAALDALPLPRGYRQSIRSWTAIEGQRHFRLRAATEADTDFVCHVAEATMRGYVEQTWGKFDPDANRKAFSGRIAARQCSIIIHDEADVGILSVGRLESHIQLDQVFILPAHQNRGIGTALVRELAREAKEAGKPLRLRVLNVNPARKLYEREGFRVTSTTPERTYMELSHAQP